MADRLPPMQALRAFEAAARMRSLTRAAESLHLTHGAISHQIKALEADFGVRLVERAGRGIRLTDEGERFASRVRIVLSDLADAVREVTERASPRQLRVSVMPSFAARWLLPRIGRFLAAHPDIDLDVGASAALADFRRDDIDAAIRYGGGNYPGAVAEHLMEDVYFPVCSPRLAGGRLPARPADLAHHTLLRSENEFWQPWFAAAGLDWPEPTRGARRRALPELADRQRSHQRRAGATFSDHRAVAAQVLPRLSSPARKFTQARGIPAVAAGRDRHGTARARRAGSRKASRRGSAAASGARTRRERS